MRVVEPTLVSSCLLAENTDPDGQTVKESKARGQQP